MAKEKILMTSRNLFMKYGVKSVSMDDIAKQLGISKKTIYTFIENKQDLVFNVFEHYIKEEHEIINKITEASTNAIEEMAMIAKYVIETISKMKPTLTYDLQKYYLKTWELVGTKHFKLIENVIQKNIIRGKKEGFYRAEIDETIHSKMYISLTRVMVDESEFPSSKFDKSHLYKNAFNYHLNGIMNELGRKEISKIFEKTQLT